MLVTVLLEDRILNLLEFIVFRTEGFQGIYGIKKKLNNAILLKFAITNNFRTNKKSHKGKCFVGNFNTQKGNHGN